MRRLHASCAIVLIAAAAPASRYDWSTEDLSPYGAPTGYDESRAICARVSEAEPPQADRPTSAQTRALRGCDSEALFYGIGRPADPVRARLCAFTEKDEEAGHFGGRALLMTIYATGRGAAQNIRVATHLACGIGGAPAEVDSRIKHLQQLKPGEDFSICDDFTSGYMAGVCAAHDARKASARRRADLTALAQAGGFVAAPDWQALVRRMETYAEAHGRNDIDLSGSARGAFATAAMEEVRAGFLSTMHALASGKVPSASPAAFAETDAELNRIYRAATKDLETDSFPGTPTRAGMREAGRAWLAYRDTMLAFAARRYPATSRSALAALLTRQRIKDLTSDE